MRLFTSKLEKHLQRPALLLSGIILISTLFFSFPALAQNNNALQVLLNPVQSTPGTSPVKKPPLSYELKPGKSLEDVFTIQNFSSGQSYKFRVYAVDAIQSSDGASGFKLEDKKQNHVGDWIKFNQKEVEIKPGETALLPYSLIIPTKVTPGTYQGGLVAELISRNDNKTTDGQNTVIISTRLIEPVYISIPGRKTVKYNLNDFSYQQIGGLPSFYMRFSNNGNVFLKTSTKLSIRGTLLEKPYQVDLADSTILQGESLEKVFKFENPPLFGEYKADLTMEISEYNVAKNELMPLNTVTKTISFYIIPWHCLIFLLLLIILLPVCEYLRRRYFRENPPLTFGHLVKKGETVVSIADLYQISWKKIIKLNKLAKPYTIKPGRLLELPFPKTGEESVKKNPPS